MREPWPILAGDSRFKIFTVPELNVTEAKVYCQELNATLAVIDTVEKYDAINTAGTACIYIYIITMVPLMIVDKYGPDIFPRLIRKWSIV